VPSLTETAHREAKENAEAKEKYMKVRNPLANLLVYSVVDRVPRSSMLRVRRSKRRRTSLV